MKPGEVKIPVTPVKLAPELKDWLKHMAIDNRRTLSNEIVYRLQESKARQQEGQSEAI